MLDTHVTQKTCWQKKSRVLHRTFPAFPRERKLRWIRQQISTKVAVLLLLHDKGIFIYLIRIYFIIALSKLIRLLRTFLSVCLYRREVVLLRIVAVDLRTAALILVWRLEAQEVLQHRCGNIDQVLKPIEYKHWILNSLVILYLLQLFLDNLMNLDDDA